MVVSENKLSKIHVSEDLESEEMDTRRVRRREKRQHKSLVSIRPRGDIFH